jgi:GH43 family beta-xylosidase
MINYLVVFFISLAIFCSRSQNDIIKDNEVKRTFSNPVFDGQDPWYIKKDNYYYYCFSSNNSITISKSPFLTKRGEMRKVWSAPQAGWNRVCVWAPELHFFNGHWYIYYAAGESGPPFIHQKTGVLQSETDDPFSNYIDKGMLYTGDNPDMKNDNRWAIDMTVFEFKNKLYAVWSGWINAAMTDKTPQHLYIAEMANPFTIKGLRTKISSPDQSWETGGALDLEEGPEVLIKNDNLFIVYSCRESWTINYRLGLLKLKNIEGSLASPFNWEKSGPVFQGPFGAGHCSFTTSPDGTEEWIIYHSKKSTDEGWKRDVRLQPFKWDGKGYPDFGEPVLTGIGIKRPSGEYKLEKQNRL